MGETKKSSEQRLNASEATLFFNTRDELVKVRLEKVVYFEADSNYCHVFFINGAKATLLASLNGISNLIQTQIADDNFHFIRIGKKYIVNQKYIFHINIPKQRLLLTDFDSPIVHEVAISKEALKKLKLLYRK